MYKTIFFLLLSFSMTLQAQGPQNRARHGAPVLREVSNQQVVKSVYPEASTVNKIDDFWYKIVNAKGKTLGYAMTSTDYCKDVKGFANVTPVMVITDKKHVIQKVTMLSNYESAGYVSRLESAGFFNKWNGKDVKNAKLAQLDGYTGATFTAKAVAKNVDFLLENGSKKLPK